MKTILFLLPLLGFIFADQVTEKINEGFKIIKTSGNIPKWLPRVVNYLNTKEGESFNEEFCESCKATIEQVINHRRHGSNKESMTSFLKLLCYTFTDWGKIVCDGFIDIEIDTVLYIIDNNQNLTSDRVCAISFQQYNCTDPRAKNWVIPLPPKTASTRKEIPNKDNALNILHLTDFHYDPLYKVGTNAKCDVSLCCEEGNGPPVDPKDGAGYWGDYNVCDMPWYSFIDLMTHINKTHDHFDLIYYTGDIISHKSWATSKDHNIGTIRDILNLLEDSFKNNTIYPILGNHEPHPTDFYSPGELASTEVTTQWLFDLVAEEWSRWLSKDTQDTIKQGGYYTVLVRKGFRIVALNSNVCFTSNLWLLYEDEDPYDQLKWLVGVLSEAEKNDERVHILSHIPPGETTCSRQWAKQFRRIVNRFSHIISAQFNGHTHLDELRVFYDLNNTKKVVNVAFNAGSFTTFIGLNPNYRIYQVDPENYMVANYDHYTYNLTEANLGNSTPNWYKIYSFKEDYGMKDLSYDSFGELVDRMTKNQTLVKQYRRFSVRESYPEMSKNCTESCLAELLCTITAVDFDGAFQCGLPEAKTESKEQDFKDYYQYTVNSM